MNIITLRDYAKQNKISYEAVRKQVVRYKDELEGHLIKDGRQQFLDEEAVTFLDAKRQKNPVAIIQQDKDETIEALRQERENLLIKIAEQADKIAQQANELREADKALKDVDRLLLSAKEDRERADALEAKNRDLSADNAKKDETLKEEREDSQKRINELEKALQEERKRRITLKEWWNRRKNKG